MARPRLRTKKSKHITLRTFPEQKSTILRNSKSVGMTMTKFMLNRALYIPIRPKYDDQMIHRLNRAAGLLKKIAIYHVSENYRWTFWAVLKDMRNTVLAINAVVSRELELPKVIGAALLSLGKAVQRLEASLEQRDAAEESIQERSIIEARESAAAVRGAFEMISVAYQRELERVVQGPTEDSVLDHLLDTVVIAAALKDDILRAHRGGLSPKEIKQVLKADKCISLPESAIALLIGTADEVAR